MFELHQITQSAYYIESPAKIGLIRLNETDVCLIDSGNDKDAGRKVRQILDANGWKLKAIYNTHSNADHIGGNKYLQTQTGCDIFAAGIERDFTMHPILEPSFLYGAYPPKSLRHKFLMAQESEADLLTPEALPEGISVLPLPGHFFDMVGYRSADGAVGGVASCAGCCAASGTVVSSGAGVSVGVGVAAASGCAAGDLSDERIVKRSLVLCSCDIATSAG